MDLDFNGIDWTAAAIIAALIAATATIAKELVTFLLDLAKQAINRHYEYSRILGRVAHHYFQMGVGASKALAAWSKTERELKNAGFEDMPIPPHVDFLFQYEDMETPRLIIDIAGKAPELVSSYLHAVNLVSVTRSVYESEHSQLGVSETRFTYPRTRNMLRELLAHVASSLNTLSKEFPNSIWPGNSPRSRYENAAKEFSKQVTGIPVITPDALLAESMAAMEDILKRQPNDAYPGGSRNVPDATPSEVGPADATRGVGA